MSFERSPDAPSRFRWSAGGSPPPAPDAERTRSGAMDDVGIVLLQTLAGAYLLLHVIGVFVMLGQINALTGREQDARFGLYALVIYTVLMLPTIVLAITGDRRAGVYVVAHTAALLLLGFEMEAGFVVFPVLLVALVAFGVLAGRGFTAAGEREYVAETRHTETLRRQETRIRGLEKDAEALRDALRHTQPREPAQGRDESP